MRDTRTKAPRKGSALVTVHFPSGDMVVSLERWKEMQRRARSAVGRLGGRPSSGRPPTNEQLFARLHDIWFKKRFHRRGMKAALAKLVNDLAAEYEVDERQARRWISRSPIAHLKRR
jgi:hypothetical protein